MIGARSAAGVKRVGGNPDKKLPKGWNAINPKTGTPKGIGKGWNYAPGASVADRVQALASKVRHWDYSIGKAFMADLPQSQADALANSYRKLPSTADDVRRYAWRVYDPKPELPDLPPVRTIGRLNSDHAKTVKDTLDLDVSLFDFSLTETEINHIIKSHGNLATEKLRGQVAIEASDFAFIPEVLNKKLTPAGLSKTGRPVFKSIAIVNGFKCEIVVELRKGRKTFTVLSYRKWRE